MGDHFLRVAELMRAVLHDGQHAVYEAGWRTLAHAGFL